MSNERVRAAAAIASAMPRLRGAFSVWNANASGSSNGTVQVQWQLPAAFSGVRLVYTNYTTADITLAKARIAATTTKGGNGATLTWSQVTFSGSASVTLPHCVAAAPNEQFTPIVSDLVQISPLDNQNLLYTRSDYAGNFGCCDPGTGNMAQWNNNVATATGLGAAGLGQDGVAFQWQSGSSTGVVANDTTGITMSTGGRVIAPDSLLVNYTVPTISVGSCGGSHLRGDTTYGDNTGFVYRACSQKSYEAGYAKLWSPANYSRSGGGSAPALANIRLLDAAGLFPQILVILASSGDDGSPTATREATAQMRLTEVLELCFKNRCRPIVATAPPVSSYDDTQNALRVTQNNWALNLRYHGISVIDLDLIYRDPANPRQILPAWTGLGIHANDAGQAVAATYLAAML
jgi:hypothetical protein